MTEPLSITPNRIEFPGATIDLEPGDAADDTRIFMEKSHWYIDSYRAIRNIIADRPNILEVGVFKGGSAAFLNEFFEPARLVCVDLKDQRSTASRRYHAEHGDTISAHMNVDQADKPMMASILNREFAAPIDLVIDDASHFYAQSKATFEVAFPRLRSGGIYVLEDWTWSLSAHAQAPDHYWAKKPSLVNLLFEFVLMTEARDRHGQKLVADMRFGPGLVWLVRGNGEASPDAFLVDDHKPLRGRAMPLI